MLNIISVCIHAFRMRHARRMSIIVLSSMAFRDLPIFFPHFLIKGTIFWGKNDTEDKMCVSILFKILYEKILFLRIMTLNVIISVPRVSYKVPFILLGF